MANNLPQIENSELTQYIAPKDNYIEFKNDEEMIEKTREWGINTKTSKKTKFWYKQRFYKREVEVVGYQVVGVGNVEIAVIKFQDDNVTCILPVYLKEMQSNNFGTALENDEELAVEVKKKTKAVKAIKKEEDAKKGASELVDKGKLNTKVNLKVTVERFDTVYNHFADKEEPVVILKDVVVTHEGDEIKLDKLWCSLSKTLEKLELEVNDVLECAGTIVENKYKKEVQYKLNRPSKIKKA